MKKNKGLYAVMYVICSSAICLGTIFVIGASSHIIEYSSVRIFLPLIFDFLLVTSIALLIIRTAISKSNQVLFNRMTNVVSINLLINAIYLFVAAICFLVGRDKSVVVSAFLFLSFFFCCLTLATLL